jgi:RHS repeat-associated protein
VARLAEAATDNCGSGKITDEWFSYDADGRLTDVYESPYAGSAYYHTTASYWANDSLDSLSGIPGVPTIYYGASNGSGLDGEGRVTKVSAASGTNPVTSVSYSATATTTALPGSLTHVTFGTADSDGFTYDPNTGRQTSYSFNVQGTADKGTLTWNPNGTLGTLKVADNLPGALDSQTCNYFYDDLGRLGGKDSNNYSVDCGSVWQQLFTFDAFGNIQKSGSSSFLATYAAATNRFRLSGVNVQYDGNGNLLTDNLNTYTWDPNFGNPTSINGITLTYDALGRMVAQNNGSTEILYSPAGKTALMNGQTLVKAFVPLPGGGTAIYNSTGLAYFRHSDWLGSSRLTSTVGRAPYSMSAYAPFGEQYAVSGTSDPSFTGQNSDTVNTLYDFTYREHSPSQGRWVSPDPSGMSAVDPTSPQSWNRYSYAMNNPLRYIDPNGLWCVWGDGTHDDDPLGNYEGIGGDNQEEDGNGNATEQGCADQGGYWDSTDTITGCDDDAGTCTTNLTTTINVTANNGVSGADLARCAAQFSSDHSLAAGLDSLTGGAVSKDNLFVNALLGSDAATLSNLITGPNRAQNIVSKGISQGTTGVVKVIGNLPNPAATGLASMGTATIRETAGGTAFVSNWTDATVATSLFGKTAGKAFFAFSVGKAIWDGSTYLFGAVQCY